MRLGYERIVKDKRIQISVEEYNDPWVTLKVQGLDDMRFKSSDDIDMTILLQAEPEVLKDIVMITEAVHGAYQVANNSRF